MIIHSIEIIQMFVSFFLQFLFGIQVVLDNIDSTSLSFYRFLTQTTDSESSCIQEEEADFQTLQVCT